MWLHRGFQSGPVVEFTKRSLKSLLYDVNSLQAIVASTLQGGKPEGMMVHSLSIQHHVLLRTPSEQTRGFPWRWTTGAAFMFAVQ